MEYSIQLYASLHIFRGQIILPNNIHITCKQIPKKIFCYLLCYNNISGKNAVNADALQRKIRCTRQVIIINIVIFAYICALVRLKDYE